jgi:hypothetical protein
MTERGRRRYRILLLCRPRLRDRRSEFPAADRRATATERSEELVRDASVLAARIIEHLQNKKVRTAILVFEACRNNPPAGCRFASLTGCWSITPI